MDQEQLIESAFRIILEGLDGKVKPAVMFSGGKDSVVMLHLVSKRFKIPMDVIFHKEPFFAWKHDFGDSVLREFGCYSYDWLPMTVALWEGKEIMAFTNLYQISGETSRLRTLMLPKNIIEPEAGTPWLCGRDAFFKRPLGGIDYKWDSIIVGHKSIDRDQIAGEVPLHVNSTDADGLRAIFPLRHWTDRDIWAYTKENNLPIDHRRYNSDTEKENPNKNWNPDYFHACIACMDRRRSGDVLCPKTGKMIPSVSSQTPYHESPEFSYYGVKDGPITSPA